MDNEAKHVSINTLKLYWGCEIEIEAGTPYSPDIKIIKNVNRIIRKKKLKEYELKSWEA